jgi:hypothetical protein
MSGATNKVAITAYGEPEDRLMLEAISKYVGVSGSNFIIMRLREAYRAVYGDKDPAEVLKKNT